MTQQELEKIEAAAGELNSRIRLIAAAFANAFRDTLRPKITELAKVMRPIERE